MFHKGSPKAHRKSYIFIGYIIYEVTSRDFSQSLQPAYFQMLTKNRARPSHGDPTIAHQLLVKVHPCIVPALVTGIAPTVWIGITSCYLNPK